MTDRSISENARIEPVFNMRTDTAAWAQVLMQGRQSLLVLGSDQPTLQALSERLQGDCQGLAPTLHTVHFSARDAAAWLGHFNAALALQGLEQAMQPQTDPAPKNLCFIHEAQALDRDAWELLLRLPGHFPGLPLRWVLLLEQPADGPVHPLALQATHTAHWRLEDTTKPMASEPTPPAPPTQAPEPAPAPKLTPPRRTIGQARPQQPVVLWTLVLLSLLALGAWVVHLRPAQGPSRSTPVTPPAPSKPEQKTTDTQPPLLSLQTEALSADATNNTDALKKEVFPIPERVQPDHQWLTNLPKDHLLIQRGVFDTVQQAQRFMQAGDELANARIIMQRPDSDGQARFLVVTGPFRSLERAQNFKFRLQLPNSTPIEQVDLLLEKSMPWTAAPATGTEGKRPSGH